MAETEEEWDVTRRRLAKRCKDILAASGIKPTSVTGRKMIHMFFAGALVALEMEDDAWVITCLMTGRHDELLKED